MKKLMIIVVMLGLVGCAGLDRAPDADKPIEFVLDVPGKTKDQLFSASKSWIAETFVSAKSVIDDADKDSGRIIAKGRIKHPCVKGFACGGKLIGFTLRIDTKDGKLRTTFTNPTVYTPSESGHWLGLTYIKGTPESEHAIWADGDLADAKNALKTLGAELQRYAVDESAASKNW